MNDEHKEMISAMEVLGTIRLGHRAAPARGVHEWYAACDHVEIGNGAVLLSPHGNGDTPEEAIEGLFDRLVEITDDEFLVTRAGNVRLHWRFANGHFRVIESRAFV